MERMLPRVHVVDDSEEVRNFLCELLRTSGYEGVPYGDALEFLERYRPCPPECLLMDIRLPRITGLELQRRLATQNAGLPVILMTGYGSTSLAVKAFKQGAQDFLEKPLEPESLLDAVAQAIEKDRSRLRSEETRQRASERLARLTKRERAVFELVATGLSSKNVASVLGIKKKTVDVHRARVMHKLEAGSIADLVRISFQSGATLPARPAIGAETPVGD